MIVTGTLTTNKLAFRPVYGWKDADFFLAWCYLTGAIHSEQGCVYLLHKIHVAYHTPHLTSILKTEHTTMSTVRLGYCRALYCFGSAVQLPSARYHDMIRW